MKILLVRYMLTFILIFQSNENYSFVTSVMYLNIQAVILCYTFVCVCVCVCVFYRYLTAYTQEDFPLQLKLRQNVNLEAKVESKDKRLSVLPDTCYAAPKPSQNDAKRVLILKNG